MRSLFSLYLFTLFVLSASSCSTEHSPEDKSMQKNITAANNINAPATVHNEPHTGNAKKLNGVTYSAQLLTALDFLERKNEKVSDSDKKDLAEESVLVLTIDCKTSKDPFDLPQSTMDKESALQYLTGEFLQDISLEQQSKTFTANGSNYENTQGSAGKLNLFVFFKGLNHDIPAEAVFYDRLFGAGMMRFKLTN